MNVARFNFSHGSQEEHGRRLEQLKRLRKELDLPVAAMLDTRGPEIRLGTFEDGEVLLRQGEKFVLTAREVAGDETCCSVTYRDLPKDVRQGDAILLDDGRVRLMVLDTTATDICCRVENDGVVKDRKGVNVPGVRLDLPYLSGKDREDLLFGAAWGFDSVAASFVRTAEDVWEIRRLLERVGSDMEIIAKIENRESVDHLAEILEAADGIMIARGDMGVEIDFTELPVIQKEIIRRCVRCGKPVITATQMLDSMMEIPRPTRAEITDVANAIYDGTSAVMLSGETASGRYPVEAVRTMAAIAARTEADINYGKRMKRLADDTGFSVAEATAYAACTTAMGVGADAILTVSRRGLTARLVSRFRPVTPVVALLTDETVRRKLALCWGVQPVMMPHAADTDALVKLAIRTAEAAGLVKSGDLVVVTAGVPAGGSGSTNMIRICRVEAP